MPADTTPESERVFLPVSPASSTIYSHTGFFSLTFFLNDTFHLCNEGQKWSDKNLSSRLGPARLSLVV